MKVLGWSLILLTIAMLAYTGPLPGIYDPLWVFLAPKLGMANQQGMYEVAIETIIICLPAVIGAAILWLRRAR